MTTLDIFDRYSFVFIHWRLTSLTIHRQYITYGVYIGCARHSNLCYQQTPGMVKASHFKHHFANLYD